MRWVTAAGLAVLLCCSVSAPAEEAELESAAAETSAVDSLASSEDNQMVFRGLGFRIDSEASAPDVKRSLHVHLASAPADTLLEALCVHLRSLDASSYEETYIAFYLPEETGTRIPWTIARFMPELSMERLAPLAKHAAEPSPEPAPKKPRGPVLIGRWIDEGPLVYQYSLNRIGSALYLKIEFTDGSSTTKKVKEREIAPGRRLDPVPESRWGDYWILTHSGDLESRDYEGLISTARRVK